MALLFLVFGIFTLTVIEGGLLSKTSRASHCRSGWTNYEGACYLFVTGENDTWIEATTHCNVLHGYLADILDVKENEFITNELRRTHAPGCYYISATDVEVEGQWVWPNSDSPVEYLDWAPSEPQNAGGGENCICLASGVNYQWIDVPCHSLRHFMCKMRLEEGGFPEVIG
ncbi:perlucin-like protein isoform X2 [Argopecten irradians]|uniref:perlucin-like protein isoform X2 n=1 Tax=Argopecten irradians TaxID=31199 RepID=UPI0037135A49